MPEQDEAVTKKALTELLFGLCPEDKLDNALYNLGDGQVSRAAFAKVMNTLLNRYATDKVVIGEGETLPRDLSLTSGLAEDVLTAALTYNTAEDGLPMMQAVLEMPWEPGFTLLDGWLYYADENGTLLRNGKVGTMVFGEDGRYTSGDAELDEMVAGLIAGFVREDPTAERMDLLYTAFEYSRDSFTYVNKLQITFGATGWEADAAKQMLSEEIGNCFNYAAVFWALARGLGYDAECISGLALAYEENHGWVEIMFDGENYIFDPQTAMVEQQGRRTNWGEDMFMVPMYLAGDWRYIWP